MEGKPLGLIKEAYEKKFKTLATNVVEWVRDYLNSFGGNTKAVIGISGGKDSTIAAKICVEAVGADRVIGVRMPNGVQHDLDVAKEVCDYLGIESYEINIAPMTQSMDIAMAGPFGKQILDNSIYYSNMPARVRMNVLYAVAANYKDARVVNTCNRSEDTVGYSTKFGDSAGDFSPLMHLTVFEVKEIGRALGIPDKFIDKKPEDGLSGKTDEDNLGFTYAELDMWLLFGIEPKKEVLDNIIRRHDANLHKLRPMPAYEPYGLIDRFSI